MPRRSRPRGHIEELPSGHFRAKVYAGTDPLTRKRRYLVETVSTGLEAERALTRLQHQVDENRHPKSSITVGRAVEQWLEVAKIEPTTRERYEDIVRLYIAPVFGEMQAAKLDAEMLERLYARLQRCRELCNGRPRAGHTCRPLAASTTRKVHQILHTALGRAVRWRHLGVNPAAAAEPPPTGRANPDPPSPAEATKLLNDAWTDPEWGMLVWLSMIIGARRGEISALRWRDIDADRATLWVSRANSETRAGGVREKTTKTGSRRRIALDPHTLELLAAHRKLWQDRVQLLGLELGEDAFVFSTTPDATRPYPPSSISQRYRRMATKLGLRSTRLHSLRHYAATELVAAGVDIRTVAGRLGHGGGTTTLKIYAAWVEQADRSAATTLSATVPRPVPTIGPSGPYASIADDLRQQIESGRLAPGAELPTVAQLAVSYGVAVGTAHRAMAKLKQEGLIDVTRGPRATVARAASEPA
ncbi:tyrosine-type recombinase/integrase [Pseudonocardia halophobica]|uniref:tyrosine-type recombinase/integrase n=1 Tax=Pseudonocardia halophobica TaxID=29401 RepID=UPI003D8C752C